MGIAVSVGINSVGMGVSVTLVVGVGGKRVGVSETTITILVWDATGDPIGIGVAVSAGEFAEVAGRLYSICSTGAPAWSTSYASATRLPVPVMIITSELPVTQPC